MTNQNNVPTSGTNLRAQSNLPPEERRDSTAQAMSRLLGLYPDLSDADRLELVEFLKQGHPDVIAMATYGAGLEHRVIALKKDHPEHFQSGFRALLPWIGILVLLLLLWILAQMM